jgi:hypothetical protein
MADPNQPQQPVTGTGTPTAPVDQLLPPVDNAVKVINPQGNIHLVPVDQVDAALKNDPSFRPMTVADQRRVDLGKQYGGFVGQGLAAGLGLARGVGGPLVDVAGTAIGGDKYREIASAVAEENPGTLMAGELAGFVGPALLTGGASVAAKAGATGAATAAKATGAGLAKAGIFPKAVELAGNIAERGAEKLVGNAATGVVARGAQRAAAMGSRFAAETAAFELSNQVTDDLVKNHEMHAENYFSAATRGALTGAAIGAPLGFVGGVIGRVAGKGAEWVAKPSTQAKLENIAYDSAVKATGAKTPELKKIVGVRNVYDAEGNLIAEAGSKAAYDASIEKLGKTLLEKDPLAGVAPVNITTKPGEVADFANLKIRQFLGNDLGKIHTKVADASFDVEKVFQRLNDEVLEDAARNAFTSEHTSAVRRVLDLFNNAENRLLAKDYEIVFGGKSEIPGKIGFHDTDAKITWYKDDGGYFRLESQAGQPAPVKVYDPKVQPFAPDKNKLSLLQDIYQDVDRSTDYKVLAVESPIKNQYYLKTRGILSDEYQQAVRSQYGDELADRLRELNDQYSTWKNIEALSMPQLKRSQSNNFFGLNDIIKGGVLASIGTHTGGAIGAMVGGPVGGALGGALLGTAGGVAGALGNRFVRGRASAVVADRAMAVLEASRLTTFAGDVENKITKAAESFVRGTGRTGSRLIGTSGVLTPKQYQTSVETVTRLARDPMALNNHVSQMVTPAMASSLPSVVASVAGTAQRQVQFLASKLPPDPQPINALQPTIPGSKYPRMPSMTDRAKWSRYIAAVENPELMLRQAAAGQLDRETVEAVRAVYPNMFNRMRSAILTEIPKLKKPLNSQQTAALSLILDTPISPTQQPSMIAMFQQAFEPNFAEETDSGVGQSNGAVGVTNSKPARPIDVDGKFKTTVQGMEGRIR